MAKKYFCSLDRHYSCEAEFDEPDRYRDLLRLTDENKLTPQGSGVSYVAASFGEGATVIGMRKFNRILDFDPESETVEAEAGITLGKLFDFLMPRGYYVSVQPGYPQLCLGGQIAANVHGKNQYIEGVFAGIVENLTLFHPSHGLITLSREERPELFELTCGGYGLTGIIVSARIKVSRLPGTTVTMQTIPVSSMEETCQVLTEAAHDYDLLQSWNNLSVLRGGMGKGFVITGKFSETAAAEVEACQYKPLDPHNPGKFRPPVFGRYSMPFINWIYYFMESRKTDGVKIPLFDFLFPVVKKSFYFDFYGSRGFIEHQVLIPTEAALDYIRELQKLLRGEGIPVPRASLKLFRGRRRLLQYNGTGLSLSMDLYRSPESFDLLAKIDALDCEFGAHANIIKDSRLSAATVRRQYPGYGEFKERLHAFDPKRVFTSALSQRLEL